MSEQRRHRRQHRADPRRNRRPPGRGERATGTAAPRLSAPRHPGHGSDDRQRRSAAGRSGERWAGSPRAAPDSDRPPARARPLRSPGRSQGAARRSGQLHRRRHLAATARRSREVHRAVHLHPGSRRSRACSTRASCARRRSARGWSVDESSVAHLPGVRVVRLESFLAVVAKNEWAAVRAARELKATWTAWQGLPGQRQPRALSPPGRRRARADDRRSRQRRHGHGRRRTEAVGHATSGPARATPPSRRPARSPTCVPPGRPCGPRRR